MRPLSNLPASVRARLLNLSKAESQTFQSVLTRYAIERLLYRLAVSPHADHFVLKGAQLFRLWFDTPHRTTRDLDLAGYGLASDEELVAIFRDLCDAEVEPDGMTFDPRSVRVEAIRAEQEYQGQRVVLQARLEQARIQVPIDIGFGDAVVPAAEWVDFPTLLEFPSPHLRAYPPEATIAEKLHAMVLLEERNSRSKDFFDVWMLASHREFEGLRLWKGIAATFERRQTPVPSEPPVALTEAFAEEPDQVARWQAFMNRLTRR